MAFVPKKRNYKIRWKFVAPLLLLLVLLIYAIVSVLLPEKEAEKKFTVCSLNEKKTVDLLNKKAAETYTVKDMTYYGESLGLYSEAYQTDSSDTLSGKTMKVTNLCTGKTITLTNDTDIDQKLTLNDLEQGFYAVSIIDNLVEKRLVYKEAFHSDSLYTVKRNDKVNKVSIVADKELLKDYNIQLADHYLFLDVKQTSPAKDKIDVYLDPYGMSTDFQYVPDEGNTQNGLSEYQEMYDTALTMKKELESYGLRVEISRSSAKENADKAYGKDGRLARAYQKDARYYIMLRFNKSETQSLSGLEVWHSSYASSVLGKNIVYGLQEGLGMTTSTYVNVDGSGVGASPIDKKYYDSNIYLRETGGKATFAAQYSQLSKEENASFKDAYGMNAVEVDFAYVSNSEDAEFWKKNKEAIAVQCAKSFAQAIGVIESE